MTHFSFIQMKFIHQSEILNRLYEYPDLLMNPMIREMQRLARDGDSPYNILLTYLILKNENPDVMWGVHSGAFIHPNYIREVWYLQSDGPVEDAIIISSFSEDDLYNGAAFDMYDAPICVASQLLQHYDYFDGSARYTVPQSKGEIMKWMRSQGIVDDMNVNSVVSDIDSMLDLNTDLNWYEDYLAADSRLSRMVDKTRSHKIINEIFERYPPIGCVIPMDIYDV